MNESIFVATSIWMGIFFCITQSAIFSGMNLALFSISRLRLEVETSLGNKYAAKILNMRKDSNFLLTTVLWGNVGINVLLTLLSNSVLAGVSAFFFSTIAITFIGEILPQAYFSRHAMRMASLLSPLLRIYQVILYPAAKPSAKILDIWLGAESIQYFRESRLREVIKRHIDADSSDIDRLEGIGALNFLALDDLMVVEEGEVVDPRSVITLVIEKNLPVFPDFDRTTSDPFLRQIEVSGKKWVIIIDAEGEPHLVLDSDGFLRDVLFEDAEIQTLRYCHRPIVVKNTKIPLGNVLWRLKSHSQRTSRDVIDRDIILVWGPEEKRVITGADILGRLLQGI
jgi:CBS domain containing-hemolysin-like protein